MMNEIKLYTYSELEKLVRAETGEEEAADVAIEVLPHHLLRVAISIRSHQDIQLLPYGIHCFSSSSSLSVL